MRFPSTCAIRCSDVRRHLVRQSLGAEIHLDDRLRPRAPERPDLHSVLVLPIMLWVRHRLGLRPDDGRPDAAELVIPLVLWSWIFEVLLPRMALPGEPFVADHWDVLSRYGARHARRRAVLEMVVSREGGSTPAKSPRFRRSPVAIRCPKRQNDTDFISPFRNIHCLGLPSGGSFMDSKHRLIGAFAGAGSPYWPSSCSGSSPAAATRARPPRRKDKDNPPAVDDEARRPRRDRRLGRAARCRARCHRRHRPWRERKRSRASRERYYRLVLDLESS